MNRTVRALAAAPALALVVALAACNHGSAPTVSASEQAALAPYKAVVVKDVNSVGGPYALVTSKTARHTLVADLKHLVPKAQRKAFVNAAANDALTAHLFTHAGRTTYVQVTLPQLLKQYGANLS